MQLAATERYLDVQRGKLLGVPRLRRGGLYLALRDRVAQAAILQLLGNGEVWTNADLKRALSHILPLTEADRQQSASRPKEEKWEELVNNALTQSGRSNSLYARGLVSKAGFGRHRLAERGVR
jgi:hypothetical protein